MRISSTLGFALFAGTLCALSSLASISEAAPGKARGKAHDTSSESAPVAHHSEAPKASDAKAKGKHAHATTPAENKKAQAKPHKAHSASTKKPDAAAAKPTEKTSKATAHAGGQHADNKGRPSKTAKRGEDKTGRRPSTNPNTCFHDPVSIVRGFDGDADQIVLTRCSGQIVPGALERLSVLGRPRGTAKPAVTAAGAKKPHDNKGAIQLLDGGLLTRLQAVALQFPGKALHLVSASRPQSNGSYHQSGHAVDVVVRGVDNEELVAFCRTLPNTGCGYYPNSSFVHIDSRPSGTGHVYWVDASRPGEAARYVSAWPEPLPSSDQATHHHEGAPSGDEAHLPLDFAEKETDSHAANPAPASHGGTSKPASTRHSHHHMVRE